MPENTITTSTPFGVVETQALSGDEILVSSEALVVNGVCYTLRYYVKRGVRPVMIVDGWYTDYTTIRREDWLTRPSNQNGPSNSARAKIRDQVVVPALERAMRINLTEAGRISAREYAISRLNRDITELEQKLQDKKLELQSLLADRLA